MFKKRKKEMEEEFKRKGEKKLEHAKDTDDHT